MALNIEPTDPTWLRLRDHTIARAEESLIVLTTQGLEAEDYAAARAVVVEAKQLLEEVYGDHQITLTLKVE